MKNLIQSQRNWKDFKTNNRVGIITTLFSEQFLEENFDIYHITPDNFQEEIELNSIDTVFVDNDLYETDHMWYRKNRGNLINYLKNNRKNICVIKNTSVDVAQIFKKAFILEIKPEQIDYSYNGLILSAPIQVNTDIYSPVNSQQDIDITHFYIGQKTPKFDSKKYNVDKDITSKMVSTKKLDRNSLVKLIEYMKDSRIIYIFKSDYLDEVTLEYLKNIAFLNSAHMILDHKFHFHSEQENIFKVTNNRLQILLRNPEYAFRKVLYYQRNSLLNHTSLLQHSLKKYLEINNNNNSFPRISVVTSTNMKDNLPFYFKQLNNQKYVDLEINIVTHGFSLSSEEEKKFKDECVFPVSFKSVDSSQTLGECLNICVEMSKQPVIAKIDDDDYYLEYYMIDQWLALQYSKADVVGKSEAYYYFSSEELIAVRKRKDSLKYGDFIMGATIMIESKLMKELLFADIPKAVDTNLLRRVIENGGKIYIGHPYELCVFRSNDTTYHTWQVDDLAMLKSADIVGYGDPISYVRLF